MLKVQVGIIMGSGSDLEVMKRSALILEDFGVGYEIKILSAHRSPGLLREYLKSSRVEVLIAGAGLSAHLGGVIASETIIPVIGVPVGGGYLNGLDSLYSMVQMPGGIPVGTMGIGENGARNAGLYAVQILSLRDKDLKEKLREYRRELEVEVEKKGKDLERGGWRKYISGVDGGVG